jgi:hypothetical protein
MTFEVDHDEGGLLGRSIVTGTHEIAATGLFELSSLAALIDVAGPDRIRINTMGYDPADTSQWAYVDPTGLSGATLLEAVDRGRLWVNVLSADAWNPRFAALRDAIKADLARLAPHLDVRSLSLGVLISSPDALVHNHADPEPNILWQIVGEKRVWIYPALDPELSAPAALAEVFAGGEEELPYDAGFDARADVVDLKAGSLVCWPQNSPHRVVNGAMLNVSLTVSYHTPSADHRVLVWAANRWCHRAFHLRMRPEIEHGVAVSAKIAVFRLLRKAGIADREQRGLPEYRYRLDPAAPLGRS